MVFVVSSYAYPFVKELPFRIEVATEKTIREPLQNVREDACIIFAYPDARLMRYFRNAPLKIATSHRFVSWLYCNRIINFSRKKSLLHEAQLNFHLLRGIGINYIPSFEEIIEMVSQNALETREKPPVDTFNVVIHPHSGGHTVEWGFNNFMQLSEILVSSHDNIRITIVGSKAERAAFRDVPLHPRIVDIRGETTPQQLIDAIKKADLFIGNSSGPMHIAGILHKKVVAFFPPVRWLSSRRWSPLTPHSIIFEPAGPCDKCLSGACPCLHGITPQEVHKKISEVMISTG